MKDLKSGRMCADRTRERGREDLAMQSCLSLAPVFPDGAGSSCDSCKRRNTAPRQAVMKRCFYHRVFTDDQSSADTDSNTKVEEMSPAPGCPETSENRLLRVFLWGSAHFPPFPKRHLKAFLQEGALAHGRKPGTHLTPLCFPPRGSVPCPTSPVMRTRRSRTRR